MALRDIGLESYGWGRDVGALSPECVVGSDGSGHSGCLRLRKPVHRLLNGAFSSLARSQAFFQQRRQLLDVPRVEGRHIWFEQHIRPASTSLAS